MEQLFVGTFTVGQTLDRGFRLYKLALKKVIILFLIPGFFGAYYMLNTVTINPANTNPLKIFTVSYCLYLLLSMWISIITIRYFYELSLGRDLSLGQILKLATPKDLLYIFTYALLFIVMIASIIALIIPFIYLFNFFYLMLIVIIIERRYFLGWLPRTLFLGKKRWWKTCAINAVSTTILIVPMAIAMMVLSTAVGISSLTNPEQAGTFAPAFHLTPLVVVGMIAYIAIITFVTPILLTINIVYYNTLRAEKENIDINQQLDQINAANQ